jgi:hypothetical protein
MFFVTWLFDKIGYIPKPAIKIDLQQWPFPVAKKVAAKKTVKKTVKIPKATTRKTFKPK